MAGDIGVGDLKLLQHPQIPKAPIRGVPEECYGWSPNFRHPEGTGMLALAWWLCLGIPE